MTTLVARALLRGLVSGSSEKRALTGLFPTRAFQACGLGLEDGLTGLNRRLPCGSCCAVVIIRYVAYLLDSERVETANDLRLNRSEAGAAACGTNVLGSAGGLNRTFVLLFLNRHLN